MRNREVIEREINSAREDLESSLHELRHVVAEKVDVKARAQVAVERAKLRAHDLVENGKDKAAVLFDRGREQAKVLASRGADGARDLALKSKDGARDLYVKGRETVQERPVLVGSIAAGVIAVGALIYIARKNDWF
jgi:F0F1-type ATP synthase membrane subunit b/b'